MAYNIYIPILTGRNWDSEEILYQSKTEAQQTNTKSCWPLFDGWDFGFKGFRWLYHANSAAYGTHISLRLVLLPVWSSPWQIFHGLQHLGVSSETKTSFWEPYALASCGLMSSQCCLFGSPLPHACWAQCFAEIVERESMPSVLSFHFHVSKAGTRACVAYMDSSVKFNHQLEWTLIPFDHTSSNFLRLKHLISRS